MLWLDLEWPLDIVLCDGEVPLDLPVSRCCSTSLTIRQALGFTTVNLLNGES